MSRLLSLLLLLLVALAGCAPQTAGESADRAGARAREGGAEIAGAATGDTLSELELRFLDVGQGDAVLIRNGERVALIDAGPANRIVGQLRALGVEHLDLLLASHNHADHIGGMDAVLDSFPVRFYLDNGHPANTQIQQRVLERVESKGVTYLEASARTIALGDAQLRILPPPEAAGGDEQNNRSVGVLLERGAFRALMTGDSETQLINALLASGEIPQVNVLKAAHHGSRNGVTPGWLSRTRPEVVAISVAARNNYGHPHEAAMRYYCTGGRRVLRTDQAGDIVVTVDAAGEYQVRTERGGEGGSAAPPAEGAACAGYSAVAGDPASP